MTRGDQAGDDPIVAAAKADLDSRPHNGSGPIEVVTVQTRVILRHGDRAFIYVAGPDGIPVLQPTGEKDGGQRMVRPPRMGL